MVNLVHTAVHFFLLTVCYLMVAIDMIGKLPKTVIGCQYMITIFKWPEAEAVKSKSAETKV